MTNPNETPDLSPMAQDLIKNEAPDEAVVALLDELEETANELRVELRARGRNKESLTADQESDSAVESGRAEDDHHRHKKINPHVTPEQQAELDENFAKYWSNSHGSWKNLFRLLREFRAEMQGDKHHE